MNYIVFQCFRPTVSYLNLALFKPYICMVFFCLAISKTVLFIAQSSWDTAVGIQVPVQAHVKGRVYNASGIPHDFDHYYNFFSFSPKEDEIHSRKYEVSIQYTMGSIIICKTF